MANILEQKCPACGGMMRFDPGRSLLVCDYCGSEMAIPGNEGQQTKPGDGGFDFHNFQNQALDTGAQDLPIYICVSCGAEVIAAPEQFALTCPFCKNNIVLSDKVSGKLRPNGVIPFRLEPKDLPERMTRFYKDKVLLPKRFFSESKMGNITGVYVPFWVFSGNVSGTMDYSGTKDSTHREGDYLVTETKHYAVTRGVSMDFEGLPVDASGRIDDDMMDSLEPFDLSDCKPFNTGYLAGFTADRVDVPADDLESRAKERMQNTVTHYTDSNVRRQYGNVYLKGSSLMRNITAKYILFPVYFFDIDYCGKTYSFAVNGQSGKTVGNVPTGKEESRKYFWLRLGIIAAAFLIFFIVKYLMGR